MEKLFIPIFATLLILIGCAEKEEPKPEVTFYINISGFQIESDDFGSLKSYYEAPFDSFYHKYPSGSITFIDEDNTQYTLNTGANSIDGYGVTLKVGTYTITGTGGVSDRKGAAKMAFTIESQEIIISDTTTIIDITVKPTVALILVYDIDRLVINTYVQELPNTFYTDGNFYYTYLQRESGWHAYIKKSDGATLDILTYTLQHGYVYKIIVTDSGTSMQLDMTPTFTETELISW